MFKTYFTTELLERDKYKLLALNFLKYYCNFITNGHNKSHDLPIMEVCTGSL